MSALDTAKSLFGRDTTPRASVRYGTALADSDGGWVSVRLDGNSSSDAMELRCETEVAGGQRVTVVRRGGSYLVYAMAQTVAKLDSASAGVTGAVNDAEQAARRADEAAQEASDAAAAASALESQVAALESQAAALAEQVAALAERMDEIDGRVSALEEGD